MYQHKHSDMTLAERFYEDGTQVDVPTHVRIEYYTAEGSGAIAVERDGDTCTGCTLSQDGRTLTARLPLSRADLGSGRLMRAATVYTQDAAYPGGVKQTRTPSFTGAILWDGASDGDTEIVGEVTI